MTWPLIQLLSAPARNRQSSISDVRGSRSHPLPGGGKEVPQQLLVEHYRCDPSIIGFCDRMYYDEKLIPFRPAAGDGSSSMQVIRTEAGNHMRWHRAGGISNQREVDVIAEEVLKSHIPKIPSDRIGIACPYCRQTSRLWASVDLPAEQIRTVHRYQGRETEAFVLSTVVDEKARAGEWSHAC